MGEGHVVKFLELQFFSSEFLSWWRHYSPVRSAMISDFVPTLEFFTLFSLAQNSELPSDTQPWETTCVIVWVVTRPRNWGGLG